MFDYQVVFTVGKHHVSRTGNSKINIIAWALRGVQMRACVGVLGTVSVAR